MLPKFPSTESEGGVLGLQLRKPPPGPPRLGEVASVLEPAQSSQAVFVGFAGQVIERVPQKWM